MSRSDVYVYVIGSPSGHIKVGTAKDVEKRLRQLQLANPHRLEVAHVAGPMLRVVAEQVEFEAHHRLYDSHVQGEWFRCDVEAARAAIGGAITYVRNKRGGMAYRPHLKIRRNLRGVNE